jgi:hypothetical protein
MIKRKKTASREARTRTVEPIVFPEPEVWNSIVRELDLSATQRNELEITLRHVVADVAFYRSEKDKEPERALQTTRLKRMERALGNLQGEIDRSIHLMGHFLPHDTMAHIGRSFTFSAIVGALGEEVRPSSSVDVRMLSDFRSLLAKENQISVLALDEPTRPRREALGLTRGHQILKHFIDAIHAPLKKWVELDKLNKGGRTPAMARKYLIYCLACKAPGIIGKPATISTSGPFVRLCALLLPACGLSARGIEKAIPPIVRQVRAERKGAS